MALEVREVCRVVAVGQATTVGRAAIEVELELGPDLRDLVGQAVEHGRGAATAGYQSSQRSETGQGHETLTCAATNGELG